MGIKPTHGRLVHGYTDLVSSTFTPIRTNGSEDQERQKGTVCDRRRGRREPVTLGQRSRKLETLNIVVGGPSRTRKPKIPDVTVEGRKTPRP